MFDISVPDLDPQGFWFNWFVAGLGLVPVLKLLAASVVQSGLRTIALCEALNESTHPQGFRSVCEAWPENCQSTFKNPHWLSILHMVVCMFAYYSLHLSHLLLPAVSSIFSLSASPLLPCNRFISTVFLESIYMHLYMILVFIWLTSLCIIGCREFALWVRVLCGNLEGGMGWEVGGRLKKRGHVYTYDLTHEDIWQKPTQHTKAIILQLKLSKFFLK